MEREPAVTEHERPPASIEDRLRASALLRLDELAVELDTIELELNAMLERSGESRNLSVS